MKNKISILKPACLLACLFACLSIFNPSNSFSQLTYPTMYPSAVIPHSGDGYRLFFLYMPMEYQDNVGQDTFKLYYINTGTNRRYLARSINSGITWTDTQYVNVQDLQKGYEAIIQNPDSNKKYMSYNRWIGQNTSYMCNMVSTDGDFLLPIPG